MKVIKLSLIIALFYSSCMAWAGQLYLLAVRLELRKAAIIATLLPTVVTYRPSMYIKKPPAGGFLDSVSGFDLKQIRHFFCTVIWSKQKQASVASPFACPELLQIYIIFSNNLHQSLMQSRDLVCCKCFS